MLYFIKKVPLLPSEHLSLKNKDAMEKVSSE